MGEMINTAEHKNHVWSYDFVGDRTMSGNRVRFLTVVDEYTGECLAIEAWRSMGANEVIKSPGVVILDSWGTSAHSE